MEKLTIGCNWKVLKSIEIWNELTFGFEDRFLHHCRDQRHSLEINSFLKWKMKQIAEEIFNEKQKQ